MFLGFVLILFSPLFQIFDMVSPQKLLQVSSFQSYASDSLQQWNIGKQNKLQSSSLCNLLNLCLISFMFRYNVICKQLILT
jgi:hypothetical protein